MVPDLWMKWMTPLLTSHLIDPEQPSRAQSMEIPAAWKEFKIFKNPLPAPPFIDSSMFAVKSTALSASGIFDHSNSLIGSESDMTRVCSCASGVSFQERCIVVDQVTAATRFLH
jgi:hypothetical protein